MVLLCTPAQNGRPFRAKADGGSGVVRTVIPTEIGRFLRSSGINVSNGDKVPEWGKEVWQETGKSIPQQNYLLVTPMDPYFFVYSGESGAGGDSRKAGRVPVQPDILYAQRSLFDGRYTNCVD